MPKALLDFFMVSLGLHNPPSFNNGPKCQAMKCRENRKFGWTDWQGAHAVPAGGDTVPRSAELPPSEPRVAGSPQDVTGFRSIPEFPRCRGDKHVLGLSRDTSPREWALKRQSVLSNY